MRAVTGVYAKPDGRREIRTRIPEWITRSGECVTEVSINPHPCGTCPGGDHVHLEINDHRAPIAIVRDFDFLPTEEMIRVIDDLIVAKLAIDRCTHMLHRALQE